MSDVKFCKREVKTIILLARKFKNRSNKLWRFTLTRNINGCTVGHYVIPDVHISEDGDLHQQCPSGMCKNCYYSHGNNCNLYRRAVKLELSNPSDKKKSILELEQMLIANILEE